VSEPVQLRPAGFGDSDRLRAWRNDPATRAASRNTGEVAPDEHAAWLARRLGDPDTRIFVAELSGEPVGTVRVDRLEGDRGEIHVSLAPEARGRGLAAPILRVAARRGAAELGLGTVVANVREDNMPSLRAFQRAGFEPAGQEGEWLALTWQQA
jgi:RimJ/RimL family protein N-acetyltransferase